MAVDMQLAYGGKVVFAPNGDLAMVQDSNTSTAATRQRIIFRIFTNSIIFDKNGNPIGSADNIFFPFSGASVRAYVGANYSTTIANSVISQVLEALGEDENVQSVPAPIVTVTKAGPFANKQSGFYLNISANTKSGQPVVIPNIDLSTTSAG